ncbi:hypothetical protein EON65_54490 [archaeon]|nr:MAG: hypothetical protein EON65_54490 [archaeon]
MSLMLGLLIILTVLASSYSSPLPECTEGDLLKYWRLLIQNNIIPDEARFVLKQYPSVRYRGNKFISQFRTMNNQTVLGKKRLTAVKKSFNLDEFLTIVREAQEAKSFSQQRSRPFNNICQTGLGVGISSVAFLCALRQDNVVVQSFDSGQDDIIILADKLISQLFPRRHQLIVGSSDLSIPEQGVIQSFRCDFVFLDGSSTYESIFLDIKNLRGIANSGSTIMIPYCNVGHKYSVMGGAPTYSKAYTDAMKNGWVKHLKQISLQCDGNAKNDKCREFCVGVML